MKLPDQAHNVFSGRMEREKETVERMIDLYCRDVHKTSGGLCTSCAQLKEYSLTRLLHCPFAPDKPTCAKCPVHCYKPEMREKVRQVMRYSGPRMIFKHPILSILHMLDGLTARK